ncbi:MAG: MFS transporter [Deltaproteobacteria bacterium]|nr:MFS transporter [Deltaproteobacteria bacterium]
MDDIINKSPFEIPNVKRFIAFRVFFNARFYYPVFTIFFLDFGLTLEQFAILNAIWAIAIVVFEVPSGALADIVGRRNLLVAAGVLMVIEMGILSFAPMGNPPLLFILFIINRILSGTAEAAASGADEALAYDSLKIEGDREDWGLVLEKQMRIQSIAFIGAMTVGAAVYDHNVMQYAADLLGLNITLTQKMTIRFPVFLTFLMALMTLFTTMRMKDIVFRENPYSEERKECRKTVVEAFKLTLRAGYWILKTPFAWVVIVVGLFFDSILRMVLTLSSQYFRLIEFPEASFGLIGSGMALLGLIIPRLSRKMAEDGTPLFYMGTMAVIAFIGLQGMSFVIPIAGLLPVIFLRSDTLLLRFFLSHYLNRVTDSAQRATVLSFKGMSLNSAYGLMGLLYSILVAALRNRMTVIDVHPGGQSMEDIIFINALRWFPWCLLVSLIVISIFVFWGMRQSEEFLRKGSSS